MEKLKNYINGEWVDSSSGERFETLNPATGEVLGYAPVSTHEDIDHAVAAAREAYKIWRLIPAPKRGEIIFRAAEALLKDKQRLGELVTAEMGKVIAEGLGDVQEAIDMAYYMAGEGRRLSGETIPSELPEKDCKSVRVPVGTYALITPWNFPTAIPSWKIFPALVAGNTVIFKPSRYTPICGTEIVRKLVDAGLPKGVLNLVHGPGGEVGEYLATRKGIDGVSFTGSSAVGGRLAGMCSAPGKGITCEMGGKNAIIVMEDADLSLAVEGAIWGGFGTTGQRCTAASRVIVHRNVHDKFLEKFMAAAKGLRIGNGLRHDIDMGPLVSEEQLEKVAGYIKVGLSEGATLATGGKRCSGDGLDRGYFFEPTIFTDVKPNMRIAQEEIFGPVVSVLKAEDIQDALEIANGVEYGLVDSIYTNNIRYSALAERDLETGIVYINASTIGAEIQLPFGGEKKSGFGGKEAGGRGGALDMFTRWKVIYRDYSGKLQKAQITR